MDAFHEPYRAYPRLELARGSRRSWAQSAPAPDAASGRITNALVTISGRRAFTVYPLPSPDGPWIVGILWQAIAFAAQVGAAPLTVRVVDQSGHPVRDAVVTFYPTGLAARAPRSSGRYVISQQNLQFHPFLTIIPVGADVSFPNLDNTKHHVYSFSPPRGSSSSCSPSRNRLPCISTSRVSLRSDATFTTR